MKKILLFLFIIPTLGWTQEFHSLPIQPKVLELEKYRPLSGKLELRHIQEHPRAVIKITFRTKEINDFYSKVLNSDLDKISCTGDFSLAYDPYGNQYININSIRLCKDETGFIVAYSFGIPQLTSAQIAIEERLINDSHASLDVNKAINQSRETKVVNPNAGIFVTRASTSTVAK